MNCIGMAKCLPLLIHKKGNIMSKHITLRAINQDNTINYGLSKDIVWYGNLRWLKITTLISHIKHIVKQQSIKQYDLIIRQKDREHYIKGYIKSERANNVNNS